MGTTATDRGTLVLQSGVPFVDNDALDGRLLADAGVSKVVVLPTADAFENPERLVEAAREWGARHGVEVEPLMVLQRADALDAANAAPLADASCVYLVGDQSLHLRVVLRESPVWDALVGVLERGGLVVGIGEAGSALCDPMVDPRGGAFTIGLGLVSGMAVMLQTDTWSPERRRRTLDLADKTVVELPSGSALIRRGGTWERVGDVVAHGELPA